MSCHREVGGKSKQETTGVCRVIGILEKKVGKGRLEYVASSEGWRGRKAGRGRPGETMLNGLVSSVSVMRSVHGIESRGRHDNLGYMV